jgi:hypothetical protein
MGKFGTVICILLFAWTASAERRQFQRNPNAPAAPNAGRRQFQLNPRAPGPNKNVVQGESKYLSAIGKMAGCTATVISPPISAVTVVLKAAHCGGGNSVQFGAEVVGGFTCVANRFYQQGRTINTPGGAQTVVRSSSGDDLNVCFSTQKPRTQTYGCVADAPPALNTSLRFFGYGNPVFGRNQTRELLSGVTRLIRKENSGALLAGGNSYVTPGDSGGPVIDRMEDGDTFNVIGVNSAVAQFGNSVQPYSYFAPTGTPENQNFFRRALGIAGQLLGGAAAAQEPLICGVNFNPAERGLAGGQFGQLGGLDPNAGRFGALGQPQRRAPALPMPNPNAGFDVPTPIGQMIGLPTSVTH